MNHHDLLYTNVLMLKLQQSSEELSKASECDIFIPDLCNDIRSSQSPTNAAFISTLITCLALILRKKAFRPPRKGWCRKMIGQVIMYDFHVKVFPVQVFVSCAIIYDG